MDPRRILSAFMIIALFCYASPAMAVKYYIDGNVAGSGDGSEENPFKLLQDAVPVVGPGDIVLIKAGTYDVIDHGPSLNRWLFQNINGAQGNEIVFKPYPGDEGAVIITQRPKTIRMIDMEYCSYLVFDNLVVTDGASGFRIVYSDHITIKNCNINTMGSVGIGIHYNSSHVTVSNNTIHTTGQHQNGEGIYLGTDPVKYANPDYHGPVPDNTSDILVTGNEISDFTHEGVEAKPDTVRVTIEYNTIHDTTHGAGKGIHINGGGTGSVPTPPRDHIVRFNTIYNLTKSGEPSDLVWSGALELRGTGVLAHNNVVYSCNHNGIMIKDNSELNHPLQVFNNTCYGNGFGHSNSHDIKAQSNTWDTLTMRNNLGIEGGGCAECDHNIPATAGLFVDVTGDPATWDFHLKSTAAGAIDRGTDVGFAYHGAAPDIGAYEFVEAIAPAAPSNLRVRIQ